MSKRRFLIAVLAPLVLLAMLVGGILLSTDRDRVITIGAGARTGPSYPIASSLREQLERVGYEVHIIEDPRTLTLLDQLADPTNPIDVTFLYSDVDPNDYPNINSLGTVARLPLVFADISETGVRSLTDLKGKRIDIGPKDSARAMITTKVLAEYGVTPENSTFLNLSALATEADYSAQAVDALTFWWGDSRSFLNTMILNHEMTLIPIDEAAAVGGWLPNVDATEIPAGSFQVVPAIPEAPLPTVALLLTVVARESLSPAAVFAIAEGLSAQFDDGSPIAPPGEFPNFIDRQLPRNASAAEYYDTGAIPWQYQYLPPVIADSFVRLLIVLTVLLFISSLYGLFLPEAYSVWNGILKPRSHERFIASIERAKAEGRELTVSERQRLAAILEQQDAGRVMRERAEVFREDLAEPIEVEDPPVGEQGQRVDDSAE